jgi:two-component system sensor kinase FixL
MTDHLAAYMPHGMCLLWEPGLMALHIGSDGLIALAYFSIPLALFFFLARRPDIKLRWIGMLFVVFIVACGFTHLLNIWTLWNPDYVGEGVVKAGTAAASVFTAIVLWFVMPRALALPSAAQLEDVNAALLNEVVLRRNTEHDLKHANDELEARVRARTRELEEAHARVVQQYKQQVADAESLREAQAASREQEARLRCILETVTDAIIVIDENASIQSFSAAAERQFGYCAEEVLSRNVSMLMPSPYREEHDSYLERYQQTHERKIIGIGREVYGRRKDGSVFPMYLSVGEGNLEGRSLFVGIIHDITEQQAADRRFRELQDELLQVSRMSGMGQMASSLAHELNQPLTAVGSLLQAARRMLETGDVAAIGRARDAIDRAAQQSLRAGEIIRRLREFAARGDTEKAVVSVDLMVNEAIALAKVSNKFGSTKVDVRLNETPMVVVDKIQVQQVILNLVRNGLEAMEGMTKPTLAVSAVLDNDMVLISVADGGSGLAPEVRDRLFQPFVTTKSHGMGIGLSICRTIVEAHGGGLTAMDNPQGGTIFQFTLPLATEEDSDGNE